MVAPFVPFIYWNHDNNQDNNQDNISKPQDYFLPISQDLFDTALKLVKELVGLNPISCVKYFRDNFVFHDAIESNDIKDHYSIKFFFENGIEYKISKEAMYDFHHSIL